MEWKAEEWLDCLRWEKGLSPHTIRAYSSGLRMLAEFTDGDGPTAETLRHWFRMMQESGLAAATLEGRRIILCQYLRWRSQAADCPAEILEAEKWVRGLRLRRHRKVRPALTESQVQAWFAAVVGSRRYATRNRAIMGLMYGCGLRIGEVEALRKVDYLREMGAVKVLGKGNKERILPMPKAAIDMLERWLPIAPARIGASLFGVGHHGIRNALCRFAKRAGLAGASPHTLRHCFASHLAARGAPPTVIQHLMGHSSLATTQRYIHADYRDGAEAILRCHPLSQGGAGGLRLASASLPGA